MSEMCCVSRPFESPSAGQSKTITGSPSGLPCHLTSSPATSLVLDYELAAALNKLSPQIELHVDDLPSPVTPIVIMTLYVEGSSPAMTAASKSGFNSERNSINSCNIPQDKVLASNTWFSADSLAK